MSSPSPLRVARTTSLALLAVASAAPTVAQAADAPTRSIGITPSGQPNAYLRPVGVSGDGKQVLQTDGNAIFLRDVAAGTSRVVLSTLNGEVFGVSNDLRRVLIQTYTARVAADTDAQQDVYLWDRVASTWTLLTGNNVDVNENAGQSAYTVGPTLSGDGKVATFGVVRRAPVTAAAKHEQWRVDTTTGVGVKVADAEANSSIRVDDAGRVSVSAAGIRVGDRTLPLPYDASKGQAPTATSPDGSAVVFEARDMKSLIVVNTATGAAKTVALPSWLTTTPHRLIAPYNGGGSVLLSSSLERPDGQKAAIGRIDVSTGAITQIGGDIPTTFNNWHSVVTPNLQFAATSLFLAQLGTTPLPGVDPGVPSGAQAVDYVRVNDAWCFQTIFGPLWSRPKLTLEANAIGTDPRKPLKADVTVTMSNGGIANKFSINAGGSRELNTGRNGGWTVSARVTLTGGGVLQGTIAIPAHATPRCVTSI